MIPATSKVVVPAPADGEVQSKLQERELLPVIPWVALLPWLLTFTEPKPTCGVLNVPLSTSKEKPPLEPGTPPLTDTVSWYNLLTSYEEGRPEMLTDAGVVPVCEWQPQPDAWL